MYVVAGATGRTGRLVAENLLAHGAPVRVLARDAGAREAWVAAGAEAAAAFLDDAAALGRALHGARGFYVLLPEDPRAADFGAHRARMAQAIAGAVAASRVAHVVMLSAVAACLPSGNGPAAELHRLEHALRASGARVTALRAAGFQENVLDARPLAAREGIFPSFLPALDVASPTVATADVARVAARRLLEGPPPEHEIIDLVGPAYTVRQLAERLGVALRRPLRIAVVPREAHVEALQGAGLSRGHAEALAELFACLASGRVVPMGDRMLAGSTTLAETLAAVRP